MASPRDLDAEAAAVARHLGGRRHTLGLPHQDGRVVARIEFAGDSAPLGIPTWGAAWLAMLAEASRARPGGETMPCLAAAIRGERSL